MKGLTGRHHAVVWRWLDALDATSRELTYGAKTSRSSFWQGVLEAVTYHVAAVRMQESAIKWAPRPKPEPPHSPEKPTGAAHSKEQRT